MNRQANARLLGPVGQLGADLGLNRIAVQLYALLYLSEAPLSLDDMAGALQVSKAAVSINVRTLERWGAARRVPLPRSRRDHYEAELDVLGIVASQFQRGAVRRLDRFQEILGAGRPASIPEARWKRAEAALGRLRAILSLPLAEMLRSLGA